MGCAQSTVALPQPPVGSDSAINNFCDMARGAASGSQVRNTSGVHSALAADVMGMPKTIHQVQAPRDLSEASVSTVASACSASTASSSRKTGNGADVLLEKMTSLDLAATTFCASDFAFDTLDEGQRLSGWSLKMGDVGCTAHSFLVTQLQQPAKSAIRGHISEPHPINLSDDELSNLGIVREARYFAFSYPLVTAQELDVSVNDARVADIAFLVFGGYMYFDSDMVLKDVRAIIPSEDGCLRFGPPQEWSLEWTMAAGVDRWCPMTLPALRKLGVRYFSWLRPGESVDGVTLCRNGGFAYIFHEPCETSTLLAQFDVFFQLGDVEVRKGCPQCSRMMEWSDYCEGDYAGGWICENAATCGQSRTSHGPMRWFCPHCELDVCIACSAGRGG